MSQIEVPPLLFTPLISDACPSKILRVEDEALDLSNLEHGPRLYYDEKVKDVLKSAPQNASYISSTIQKEILQTYANRVRNVIREEIGDRSSTLLWMKRETTLVVAAREVVEVYQFFNDLSDIINIASASFKQHNELQKAQAVEITHLVSINELEIGTRINQIGTLQHLDMNAQYIVSRSRSKKEDVTVKHHYRVDIFFATIDTQLQELKSKFNE
ncbi:hypothetical protein PVK06_034157 [Gossypium arboreum]|uniref:Uncharacterized protein n=1 Tax=Gossypium arboreum TaxID=29729 RepID=A0ABR0NGB4_GOSAR|nr:hypothetical protein PVK06_034157 [Gossypium arboreum]